VTFSQTVAALCDRVYPKRPTLTQTRTILVETGTLEPSDQMIEALRDEASNLIDAWLRDEEYEGRADSAASLRTERDYI
jgi:hypothetical protein